MAKQKLIFGIITCLTLGAIGGTLMPPQDIPRKPPSLRGLTDAEKKDAIEKWIADRQKRKAYLRGLTDEERAEMRRKEIEDRFLKERIARYEYLAEIHRQAMINELRVSEAQWRIIEPKYKRQISLMWHSFARASHRVTTERDTWIKPTENKMGRALSKTAAELTEAERNIEKLIDLLRREDTTDEELRKQIDALQQAREKARKEWPKARQELASTLTTPRQEAVFLLLGHID